MNRRGALTTGSYGIITGLDNTVTAVISRHHILIIFRMARLAARTHSQCARRRRRKSKLKFTGQVRPNGLKYMDARDQRDRQQFHEAKIFDAVQALVFTCSNDAVPLRALIENIEIGASQEVPKPAAQDDRAATSVSRQVRGHIDSHKTHFAYRDHRERLLLFSLGGWIEMARRWSRSNEAPVPCGSVEVSVLGSMQSVSSRPSR